MSYIGRFAPSPTGPLHFGSLIAAVASFCDAKNNKGRWLLRMEDLDKPREMPTVAHMILAQLEGFGFEWDEPITYQSQRGDIYEHYLSQLKRDGLMYSCTCSRKEIADSAIFAGIDGAIYPKTCFKTLAKNWSGKSKASKSSADVGLMDATAQRINVDNAQIIIFKDAIQGDISQKLQHDVGDFVLKRKDGIFAYQLAVVVDDALQNISHIVRGADLLDSTPRQIYLQRLLGFTTPNFAHIPVATNITGVKLSKQTLAPAISPQDAPILVFKALQFLGQNPPLDIKNATLDEVWRWAIAHWQLVNVPKTRTIIANS